MVGGLSVLIVSVLLFSIQSASASELHENNRTETSGRFLSLFSIVRFANSFCYGTNGLNGTCFTSAECSLKGGTAAGTCAQGFGVCCTICLTSCGQTATVNNTYWANPNYPSTYSTSGQCSITVKKCSSNICQLRLDFVNFVIADPDGTALSTATQCQTDVFTVSGQSNNVPAICGINTNQHMYLDMTPGTSQFTLSMVLGSSTTSRSWKIRISQLPCGTTYTAPDNCLQWFTDSVGTFSSFNYQFAATPAVQHMANQDYTICIRMNQGFCGICYAVCDVPATVTDPFALSGTAATTIASETACLTDWIQIPCATDQQSSSNVQSDGSACINKICGTIFTSTTTAGSPTPVYSYRKPFEIRFYTDSTEASLTTEGLGFCLKYQQLACTSG